MGAVVGDGSYATLGAAFAAINGNAQTGANISITIVGNTNEGTTQAALTNNSWTSLSIQPAGGAWTIVGNPAGGTPMVDFNGADNVVVDGLNSGGNALTIENTTISSTSGTSTIRFQGDATNNVITRCTILGAATVTAATNGGNIWFGSAAVTTGNDNNTVSFCNIGPSAGNLPTKGVYMSGSTGALNNSNILIANNNIFDYYRPAATSAGLYIGGGTIDVTIQNNKFYQTAARTQTTGAQHSAIWITNTATGGNYQILGNTIGYSSSAGTGTYTLGTVSSSTFIPIFIGASAGGAASSIQGNLITAIAMNGASSGTSTSAPLRCIYVSTGLVNIGDVVANVIGSLSATGAITYNSTSTSASDVYAIYNFSSNNTTISNNSIGGITAGNSAGTPGAISLVPIRVNTVTGVTSTIQGNLIGGAVPNSIHNTSLSPNSNVQGILISTSSATITGNAIASLTTLSGNGTTSPSVAGIVINAASNNHTVVSNQIAGIGNLNPASTGHVTGIFFNSTTGTNLVAQNNIHSLVVSSPGATMNGINVAGGTCSYQNNFIRLGIDPFGSSVTTGAAINGINETTAGTNNFYHNSVYIGGSGVNGAANSFALQSSIVTNTRNYQNNIFWNARSNGSGTGKHYAIALGGTTPNPAGLTSNYNDLYVTGTGGVLGLHNAVDHANLSAWSVATGMDQNSFSADPNFVNATGNGSVVNLHIAPVPTPIEQAGVLIPSVLTDFDGQTRSSLTPTDIGADADNFTAQDISAPVISYAPLTFICTTGDRTLTATISDLTGVPTAGVLQPRIYYSKNAGPWFSSQGVLSSGNGNSGTWDFTIFSADMGGLVLGDQVAYFVIAQDLVTPTPIIGSNPGGGLVASDVNTVTTPPTTPNSYLISGTMAGTYTVGAAGIFPTLSTAVTAYNNACLTGPVVLSLIDATYPAETFPITVLENYTASAANFLTIKPAPGVTASISGASTSAILRLNGADFVVIDGSNAVGGTTRDLNLTNTDPGFTSSVIWVSNPNPTNGANNNVVKNSSLMGNATTTTLACIVSSSGTTVTSAAETANSGNVYQNNAISTSFYGIACIGPTATGQSNTRIVGNSVGSAVAANKIGFNGIFVANEQNILIEDNTVFGISSSDGTAGAPNGAGISISGSQVGGMVRRNNVYDIKNTNTGGWGAYGILLNSTSSSINMTVANNFISDVTGVGFNGTGLSDNGYGMAINRGSGYNVWHNTVYMNTDQTAATGITSALWISALVNTAGALNLRDNIFVNTQTVGSQRYAIMYLGTSNAAFGAINHNDYFTSASNLGTFNATNQANLAALQASFGGNLNSVSILPVFAGAPDLHLPLASNASLNNLGTGIPAVNTDIDLAPRSPFLPDMGADEFGTIEPEVDVTGNSVSIVDGDTTPNAADHTDFGNVLVCTGSIARTFTILNTGNDLLTISSFTLTGGSDFVLTTSPATTVNPGASTTFTVTFDPSTPGLSTATVTINSNDADEAVYDFLIQATGDADLTPPTAVCQNLSLTLDASGNASTTASAVNNGSSDACGIASISLSQTAFTCANVGANTVTLTVTDNSTNTNTCTATINVIDAAAPTAICQNLSVQLNAAGTASITGAMVNNGSNDVCGIASLSVSPSSFSCADAGINTVTLTVTDVNSNTSTCTATVTVADTVAPVASCQNISLNLDAAGNAITTAAAVDNGSSDACGIATMILSQTAFTCANVGANTVTLTVTDMNSNSSMCSAIVTVNDSMPPTAVCQNVTATLDSTGHAIITVAMIDNGSTDNCGIDSMAVSPFDFQCVDVGANTVTLTVIDVNGNTSTCTAIATINANDAVPPVANCQNISVNLDASGSVTLVGSALDNGSTDNCGIASFTTSPATLNCSNLGANTVSLIVTDGGGNTDTCSAVVTVSDSTAPNAVCQNVTVTLDAAGNGSTTAAAVNNGSTDACGIASTSLSQTAFTCANVGANTVVLTVTDVNGNSSTCSATATVQDLTAPVAACQNLSLSLDAAGNASTTAADVNNGSSDACGIASMSLSQTAFTCANVGANTVTLTVTDVNGNSSTCTATVTVTDLTVPVATCQNVTVSLDAAGNGTLAASAVNNGSTDACGITSMSLSQTAFTCANVGTSTVTLTVTDGNGNSSTCTATVTTQDLVAPTALCQNVTVLLDGSGNGSVSAVVVNNGSSDACGIDTMSVSPSTFTCANLGANTVTMTVTDVNGNSGTCTASANVLDITAPTAVCQNQTLTLDAAGNATLSASSVNNGSSDACGISALSLSQTAFTCANVGSSTVTLTVTDAGGNTGTCTATITVIDNTAPVATCQNITVALDGSGNATITSANVDNGSSDACGIGSLSLSQSNFTCANVGVNTVTLTVTDVNSNTSTCTATVAIQDTTAPSATCQALTVALDSAGNATITAANVDNGSADACGIASLSLSQTSFTCANAGANTVTLTVTDVNGNTSTCVTTVTVQDTLAPAAVCQNITVALDSAGNAVITAANVDNGSSDVCGIQSLTVSPDTFTCANIGANTVTLTVTDNASNSSTCAAVVTVLDSIAPVVTCQDTTLNIGAGGSVTITAAMLLGSASDACGIDSVFLSQYTFACGDTGMNAVTLTATDLNGNASTCTANVTVLSTPLTSTIVADTAFCGFSVSCNGAADGSATVNAAGGCSPYTYLWSNGDITATSSGLAAGSYQVTVTDGLGRITVSNVTLTEPSALDILVLSASTVCVGASDGSIDVSVSGGNSCFAYTYLWSNGATTEDVSGLAAGVYTVTVTDVGGCTTTKTITIATHPAPAPVITLSGNTLVCSPAFSSYQWNSSGSPISGATQISYVPTVTGTYDVTVVDSNGCTGTSNSLTVTVTGTEDELNSAYGVTLYPNPARGEFMLNSIKPIDWNLTMTITDMYGRQMKQYTMAHLVSETAFDISELAAGAYMVEIVTEKQQRLNLRLVVQ